MVQDTLFEDSSPNDSNRKKLGSDLILELDQEKQKVTLYRKATSIKKVDLSDKVAQRLFVVETVELGANQSKLALALNISRQTIHNYLEIKKYYGLEGLIQGYTPRANKSRIKQREINSNNLAGGNKAQQVAEIRQKAGEERKQRRSTLRFSFGYDGEAQQVEEREQPFIEQHDWETTRYAGVFTYLIPLITEWKCLQLVMGYFGAAYKIFMIFF